jgi:hypothetical protein
VEQVETSLGLEPVEYPCWLGEDDLAEFGRIRTIRQLDEQQGLRWDSEYDRCRDG